MRLLVIAVCLAVTLAAPTNKWEVFKASYGKHFVTLQDEEYRHGLFEKTLEQVRKHNELYYAGKSTYRQGINHFSDWTDEEFKSIMLMKKTHLHPPMKPAVGLHAGPILSNVDWKAKGHVTPVRDQGACGSCWAFAAVANIESAYSIQQGGKLVDMSEQQCVDCDPWSNGCLGGWHHYCYDYIQGAGGIVDENTYPYIADHNWECMFDAAMKEKIVTPIKGHSTVSGDAGLRGALANMPVAVAVDAGPWRSYKSGIFDDPDCTTWQNHAVMATGYNDDAFMIKNSWGASWGEAGYIRLARAPDKNVCGVTEECAYPNM